MPQPWRGYEEIKSPLQENRGEITPGDLGANIYLAVLILIIFRKNILRIIVSQHTDYQY